MILNNSTWSSVQELEIGFQILYYQAMVVHYFTPKPFYWASVNLSEIPALVFEVGICCETCGLLMV